MIRKIQKNNQEETERVREIWQNETRRLLNFIDDEEFWTNINKSFNDEINKADGYVYEEDESIKGFMLMENSYIDELFVDSDFQGKGIGTALLNLAKHRGMFLSTHVYVLNFRAINWYFRSGFVIADIPEHESRDKKELKYRMIWSKTLSPVDKR